ncbi:MAG: sodium/proton-translocating pyrophosphatase, partial [Bdellovibrionota bacterium]
MNESLLIAPLVAGAVGLVIAILLYFRVKAQPDGNETMNRIAGYIREGAMAFLWREYKVLAVYAIVVGGILFAMLGAISAGSFVLGAFLSLLAGFCGMKAATYANVRTTQAAAGKSKSKALLLALDGGAVMGLAVAGLGLAGLGGLFYCFHDQKEIVGTVLHSFAVGASSIALFARIGGGIYTKAADVGADIAGKVIENIPEDDPRNPGVIADNVGDNVGDVAGMGADIYESMVAAIVAAMAIGLTIDPKELSNLVTGSLDIRATAVMLPLSLSTLGLVISILVILATRFFTGGSPAMILRVALIIPPVILTAASFILMPMMEISQGVTVALAAGAFGGAIIGLIT